MALRLKIPRSRLYSRAIEAYRNAQGRKGITRHLNAVHGGKGSPQEPDSVIEASVLELFRREHW
jgi:hypothetical protein